MDGWMVRVFFVTFTVVFAVPLHAFSISLRPLLPGDHAQGLVLGEVRAGDGGDDGRGREGGRGVYPLLVTSTRVARPPGGRPGRPAQAAQG